MTAFTDLLNDLEAQDILVLYEYDAYNPATELVETVRLSSGPYTTKPTDGPASTPYLDMEDAQLSSVFYSSLFPRGNPDGMPEIDTGTDVFTNIDGQLDRYLDFVFEGYPQRKLLGRKSFDYADFGVIQSGITTSVEITQSRMAIRSKSKDALLDLPVQTETFAGTNSGSTGNEGTANDIKGNVKPLCFGECKKVEPVRVNTSAYRDMFHSGTDAQSVDAAYDQGSLLTLTTDYTTDLTNDNGLIDLVAKPAGTVTADVKGDAGGSGYVDHPVDIAERIALRGGDLVSGDIDSASLTALKAATPGMKAGIYIREERTKRECINEVLDSIRARGVFNREGMLQTIQIAAPDTVATASFNDDAIISIEAIQATGENDGIPPFEYILGFDRYWTVQSRNELAGALSDELKEELGQEFRKVVETDSTVLDVFPTSKTRRKDTLLVGSGNAATQAADDHAFLKVRWRHFSLRVKARGYLVNKGDTIEIDTNRFGFDGGKNAFVYAVGDDVLNRAVELFVMRQG